MALHEYARNALAMKVEDRHPLDCGQLRPTLRLELKAIYGLPAALCKQFAIRSSATASAHVEPTDSKWRLTARRRFGLAVFVPIYPTRLNIASITAMLPRV